MVYTVYTHKKMCFWGFMALFQPPKKSGINHYYNHYKPLLTQYQPTINHKKSGINHY